MPHQKIRAARRKVEGVKERGSALKQRGAEVKRRAQTDLRRASGAVERRVVPIEDEAAQTRREAALLARELGAPRARQAFGSARERFMGMDLGPPEGKEATALEQLAAAEGELFGGKGELGLSIDEQVLDLDSRVDIADDMDFDSVVDDMEGRF